MLENRIIKDDLSDILKRIDISFLSGKTVLISGAAGMIASYMAGLFLVFNENAASSGKIKILALVRNIEKAKKRFGKDFQREELQIVEHDISRSLDSFSFSADYIIHAASLASPKFFKTNPIEIVQSNVLGTANLLNFAQRVDARRILYISSGEVYGAVTRNPVNEADYGYLDPLAIRSCYAESKRMAENMLVCWGSRFGLDAVIARPFHTYGPTMDLDDGRIFSDFVSNVIRRQDLVIKGSGEDVRSYCYLSDAVFGLMCILKDGVSLEAYNLGNENCSVSVKGLAEILVSLYPELGLEIRFLKRSENDSYLTSKVSKVIPDTSKLAGLNWSSKVSIGEGFLRAVEGARNLCLEN